MKTSLHAIRNLVLTALLLVTSVTAWTQNDSCKVPLIPTLFTVTETHSQVPQSFWQNGGHIPENTVDEDTTNYARAHIKATGSTTLKVSALDTVLTAGTFAGFYIKSRAFREEDFSGITIKTYLNGVLQETYSGEDLWVEYIPFFVNDPICIGLFTSASWNEVEVIFSAEGPRVHYDVFYAVTMGACEPQQLPPGWVEGDTCKVLIIPPVFSATETHSNIPQSFWQNGGHVPANTVDTDTTNFARAHIKATGSATLRVSALDTMFAAGTFAGFYIRSQAFINENLAGVTIKTYLNGVLQSSSTGENILVEYFPVSVNDPIIIGVFTTGAWNEVEIILSSEGPKVHYDVYYAVSLDNCDNTGELPPGLPVTWLSFEVQKKGEASDLRWMTTQEFNNAGFQVERSVDGRFFEAIGTVDPVTFSRDVNTYSFMDYSPSRGVNYYRINQIDRDGKSHYSPIRSIGFNTLVAELRTWPNPVSGSLNIDIPEDVISSGEIRIINAAGTVVHSERYENPNNQFVIDVSRLDPGVYNLLIESATNRYHQQVVVFQ